MGFFSKVGKVIQHTGIDPVKSSIVRPINAMKDIAHGDFSGAFGQFKSIVSDNEKAQSKGFHEMGIRGWVGDHPLESAAIAVAAIYTGGAALSAMSGSGAAGAGGVTAGTTATTAGGTTATGVGTNFAAEASASSFASSIGGSSAGATAASTGMGGATGIASYGGVGGATSGAFGGGIASVGGGSAGGGIFTATNAGYLKMGLQAVNAVSSMQQQQQSQSPVYAPDPTYNRAGKTSGVGASDLSLNPNQSQVAIPNFNLSDSTSRFI